MTLPTQHDERVLRRIDRCGIPVHGNAPDQPIRTMRPRDTRYLCAQIEYCNCVVICFSREKSCPVARKRQRIRCASLRGPRRWRIEQTRYHLAALRVEYRDAICTSGRNEQARSIRSQLQRRWMPIDNHASGVLERRRAIRLKYRHRIPAPARHVHRAVRGGDDAVRIAFGREALHNAPAREVDYSQRVRCVLRHIQQSSVT